MPEYQAPGVYVEAAGSGPRSIEGVDTGTAGFVGETERGPARPCLLTGWSDYERCFGGYLDRPPFDRADRYLPYAVKGFFDNGGKRLWVARAVGAAARCAALDLGALRLEALGEGDWGNRLIVAVKPARGGLAGAAPDWFRLEVAYYRDGVPAEAAFVDPTDSALFGNSARVAPTAVEVFDDLSPRAGDANFAASVINAGSYLVRVTFCSGRPDDAAFPRLHFAAGVSDPAQAAQYAGDPPVQPGQRRGLAALLDIREIALLAIPDDVAPGLGSLREALMQSCEALKSAFAIVSAGPGLSDLGQVQVPRDSSYAAYYYPWVRVAAPHTGEGHRLVPPTGHVAGVYARVDAERGVHKVPANEVLRGLDTGYFRSGRQALEVTLGSSEQALLTPRGVNLIRDFRRAGRGIRVWGGRTMSRDGLLKYVNIRRLFIYLEQSIDRGTAWVVFEPNDDLLWARVRESVEGFLHAVWRGGALAGNTPDQAYIVRCDRSTMTQADIDAGRLICLIGVAPVKPAELVVFRIGQKTAVASA